MPSDRALRVRRKAAVQLPHFLLERLGHQIIFLRKLEAGLYWLHIPGDKLRVF